MKQKYLILASLFMIVLTYAFGYKYVTELTQNPLKEKPLVTTEVLLISPKGREVVVNAEIAVTNEQRNLGLMNRHSMPENRGMIFVWKDKAVRSFWMKNTFIPLDMIFLNDTHIIGVINNITPHTLQPRSVGIEGNAVLEVNAGFVEKNGITSDWKVMYSFTDIVVK